MLELGNAPTTCTSTLVTVAQQKSRAKMPEKERTGHPGHQEAVRRELLQRRGCVTPLLHACDLMDRGAQARCADQGLIEIAILCFSLIAPDCSNALCILRGRLKSTSSSYVCCVSTYRVSRHMPVASCANNACA